MRRFIKSLFYALLLLGGVAAGLLVFFYPFVGAAACLSCYDMEAIAPRVIVDTSMPAPMRANLLADIEAAKTTERSFYGTFDHQPYFVACSTEECDRRLGGRGAKAITLSMPLATILRLSPRGLNPTILAHELSHVEVHHRVGLWALVTGALPAWFDEGVAVLVSDDARYLKPGASAVERCVRNAEGPLPATLNGWGAKAGEDPMLYADAVCRVLQWMEANGGHAGLLKALDSIAHGLAFAPENGRPD